MAYPHQTDSDNDFAEMNGVVVPKSLDKEAVHTTEPSTSDTHQEELGTTNEPEQFVTKRQQWEQPWHKALIVGGGMLIFVTFFGSMVHGTLQAINKSTGKNSGTTNSNSTATKPPEVVENEDEVNRKIAALTTQANAISAINANKKPDSINKSDPGSAPLPNTPPKPDSTSISPPPPPIRSSTPPLPPTPVYRTTYPNSQTGYSRPYRPPALSSSPTLAYTRPSVAKQVSLPLPPPPVAKPLPSAPTTSQKAPQDLMHQLANAANVGSYGSVSPTQSSSRNYQTASTATYTSNSPKIGGLGADSVMTKSQAHPRPQLASYSSAANNIVVGTRANGKLETPIAWSGKLQNPNQNFLIQLTEPLIAANKSVAIPKGAYLVVRINDATDTGLLQMSATSALVTEKNGRTIEKPIPAGALLVLGKGGNLLKAQSQKRSNTGADLGMAVLSGVSNATGLINQPSSQSSFSSAGGFQTTTSNRDPNYLAGFGQGAAQAIVGEMQSRNQQARQSRQSESKVFVLNQGTSVQLFVNSSVSL